MVAIGISGKRNQGKSNVAFALSSRIKRSTIISVYDVIKFFYDYRNIEERDAVAEQIRQVCGNYLVDTLKLRMAMASGKYDVVIIDDIFDSTLMNQIKTGLNAHIVGVEKVSLHNLPLSVRDNAATGLLGEPDYVVRYTTTYNELLKEIDGLIAAFKEKGVLAGG